MNDVTEIQDEIQEVPAEVNELRWASLRKRRGQFKISEQMLVDNWACVKAIMGECMVTRCEHIWGTAIFQFSALSWEFREVGEGEMPSEYVWERNDDGQWLARESKVTQ